LTGGLEWTHSLFDEGCEILINCRCEIKASIRIKEKKINLKIDKIAPKEEATFHIRYAWGKSE